MHLESRALNAQPDSTVCIESSNKLVSGISPQFHYRSGVSVCCNFMHPCRLSLIKAAALCHPPTQPTKQPLLSYSPRCTVVKLALHSSEEALTAAIRCYGPWGWLAYIALLLLNLKLQSAAAAACQRHALRCSLQWRALEEIIHIKGGTDTTFNTITSLTPTSPTVTATHILVFQSLGFHSKVVYHWWDI